VRAGDAGRWAFLLDLKHKGVMTILKPKLNILLVAVAISFCSSIPSFAQLATSTEKKELISQFRKLTGADKVSGSINFSAAGVQDILSSVMEQDKELTDPQKIELRKSVAEGAARIDKVARDFLDDKSQITVLSEEVIYRIYDSVFTESELKELIAFYQTPTGQKAARFLPSLSSEVQKAFGQVIQRKLSDLLQPKIQMETEQLKQKIKDMKAKKSAN
jgi:hypothetical protein